ncbi:MAG: efflux RND transporter permease subunit [Muribaculaceae bacterium]|nr:efflux RND transporter permease subunit [Muribaculaceae bacterium]
MLNRIIQVSLENRLVVLILSALLLLTGTIVLLRTEIDIFPDLNAPTVVVMTEARGLAPEEVEKLVTYPVETSMNGAPGVRRVRSSSATGFSVVNVEFDWGTDLYRARQIVAEKLQEAAVEFPESVGSPVIGPQSSVLGEMLIIGLTADSTSLFDLRSIADRQLRPRLLALGGVSQVSVLGGDIKEYRISLDQGKMKYYDVTLRDVIDAVERVNENASGGVIYDHGKEYLVKAEIGTTDPEELEMIPVVNNEKGETVLLSDIARVEMTAKEPKLGKASVRGHEAVLLTVTKQPATGTIELTERIEDELSSLGKTFPEDVVVSTNIFRQSDFIENSIGNLQQSLFEGILFVIVVLFFFLMNLRTTMISIIALPMSILTTVIILHLMGLTINTMSLGGIAIAIGSLVDDAIVDVENVYKRLKENRKLPVVERKKTVEVVFEASKEVRMPIFNSSLIIVVSFVPLFFLQGIEGRMLIPLGIAFIVALAASTIVALTLTPVLCCYLLGNRKENSELSKDPWLTRKLKAGYSHALEFTLGHQKWVLIGTLVLFGGAVAVFLTRGRSFLPSFNEGSLTINISALPGISLEESDRIGHLAEELILSVPEIQTVARKTGRAELDEHTFGANVSEFEAPYILNQGRSRNEMVRDVREKLSVFSGTNVEIGQPISHRIDHMLSGTQAQIAIKIFGNDLTTLYGVGKKIKQEIGEIDGIVDVNLEQQIGRPQIDIRPRRGIMSRYGVSPAELRSFVETAMNGSRVSHVYEDGIPYDLTLKLASDERNSLESLKDLMVDTREGKVPLSELADIVSTTGPNTINRENVSRLIVVSANVDGSDLRGAVNMIKEKIEEEVKLPENVYVTYGGQFESESRATRILGLTSFIALLLIFMLLYQEFKSVKESLVILINMPLALIGSSYILWITGAELNIPAIIGIISLLGISTRNGMLLMSRYNHLEQDGIDLEDRIKRGSKDRLLPIIMTALTSALALIPIAIRGGEPGNEIQSPLAIVILGGLISATILNIFVVPILYRYISRVSNR